MRPELKLELFTAVFTCKLQSLQLSPENAGDLPDELLVDFAFIFLSSCSLAPYLRSVDVRNTAAMSSMDRTHRVNRLGNHALGYHEGLRIPNHHDAACMSYAQELRHKLGSKTQNKHAKHPLRVRAVTSLCQRHPAISNAVARIVQIRPAAGAILISRFQCSVAAAASRVSSLVMCLFAHSTLANCTFCPQ